jgi:aspartate aminotransferase
MKLAKIASQIDGQPMFKILEHAQKLERAGHDVIHFELGEPDFDTPPHIVDSCVNALRSGDTHYAPASGVFSFKEAVANATAHSRGFKPTHDQILVTPGANSVIYLALKCMLDEGDEVLIPDPGFPTYTTAILACGGLPVYVPLSESTGFSMSAGEVRSRITERTKAIIVNSPSNPTGGITSREDLEAIYEIARQHDLLLISDEIYSRMVFEKHEFFSPSMLDRGSERVLVLNGFSKAFAMTGWRLGVAIGPIPLIEKMTLLTSTIVSCVPPFIQSAGIAAIEGSQDVAKDMLKQYQERCRILVDGLNDFPGITCSMPAGAIYVFANITKTRMSSEEFANSVLSRAKLAVTPGVFFGAKGEGYVRFSVVTSLARIREALKRLEAFFNE